MGAKTVKERSTVSSGRKTAAKAPASAAEVPRSALPARDPALRARGEVSKARKPTAKARHPAAKSTAAVVKTAARAAVEGPPTRLRPVRGAQRSRKDLRRRAITLSQAARTHHAAMARVGWTKEMTEEVMAASQRFDNTTVAWARSESKTATSAHRAIVNSAQAFRIVLAAELRVALLSRPDLRGSERLLRMDKVQGASDLAEWFNKLHGLLKALREQLLRTSSTDWEAEVNQRIESLRTSLAKLQLLRIAQEAHAETRLVARNELVNAIESLYVHGQLAFVRQPGMLAAFRKGSPTRNKAAAKRAAVAASAKAASAEAAAPGANVNEPTPVSAGPGKTSLPG